MEHSGYSPLSESPWIHCKEIIALTGPAVLSSWTWPIGLSVSYYAKYKTLYNKLTYRYVCCLDFISFPWRPSLFRLGQWIDCNPSQIARALYFGDRKQLQISWRCIRTYSEKLLALLNLKFPVASYPRRQRPTGRPPLSWVRGNAKN
jgi:hypothetical protein